MADVYIKDCVENIKKCALEVYRELGHSYDDELNDICFRRELSKHNIPFVKIYPITHFYKGEPLDMAAPYVNQYIIADQVLVEIDSMDRDGQKSADYYQRCLTMTMKSKIIGIKFSEAKEANMFIERDLVGLGNVN